jgi:glycosyltransferase involved in cell wall biosynthesis
MRIGADGSYLHWARSGLNRYVEGALDAVAAQLGGGDEMVVYSSSVIAPPEHRSQVRARALRVPGATAWYQAALPALVRLDRCDVVLGPANVVPAAPGPPAVLVVHDCKAFSRPDAEPGRAGRWLRRWQAASARRAAVVVAVSEWTAAECRRHLGVAPERLRVVHQGVDACFRPLPPLEAEAEARWLAAVHGVRVPYVLQVGAYERHKGGAIAAAAVAEVRRRGHAVDLVRCGPPGPDPAPTCTGARDLGRVDDPTLRALYRAAAAVCVTSEHEGFGLPVVEAMACGTPVVAARAGGMVEAGGDAAVWAEPGSVAGVADGLERLLTDPEEAAHRRARGLEWAARFSWPDAGARLLDLLREAAR